MKIIVFFFTEIFDGRIFFFQRTDSTYPFPFFDLTFLHNGRHVLTVRAYNIYIYSETVFFIYFLHLLFFPINM